MCVRADCALASPQPSALDYQSEHQPVDTIVRLTLFSLCEQLVQTPERKKTV